MTGTTRELPRVIAVVLTWNSAAFVADCLRSVFASDHPVQVIVVDNNSSDSTIDVVSARFPAAEVVNTGANLGYAGGNNIGIRMALDRGADAVFLLNPDAIVEPDCIGLLAARLAASTTLAAASPIILAEQSRLIWYAGADIDWTNGRTLHIGQDEPDRGQYSASDFTGRASGCAMLLGARALRDIGLLDERYFLYYEETDWSVRALRAGYQIGLVPAARARHRVSASTGGAASSAYHYYMARNRLLFMKQHGSVAPSVLLARLVVRTIVDAVTLHPRSAKRGGGRLNARLRGGRDFARSKFGPEASRRIPKPRCR